jgi:serine/threonine-protein kinase
MVGLGSDDIGTRVEGRPPARVAEQARTMTPRDALRLDEVGRFRRFTYPAVVMLLAVALVLVPILPGDRIAIWILVGGVAMYACGATWMRIKVRNPAEWRERNLMIISLSGTGIMFGVIYYWGPFSFAPMIVLVAVYMTACDGELLHSAITYAIAATIQTAVAVGILTGTIQDRGLFTASAPLGTQIVTQIVIQALLLGMFLGGRTTRRITLESLVQAERVARETAKREAVIDEMRFEMQRMAGASRQGRFTDQMIGSFKLGLVLGRGAMGEVYEAVDERTGALAAVKLLLATHLGDPHYLERFAREAHAAAALDSPHVVRILEVGTGTAGIPYLAMERLEGSELAAQLQQRRSLPLIEVVLLVEQLARGLDAARLAGIVHRDMKPHNVFQARQLDGTSRWKILDFGVSKVAGHDGTLTHDQVIGTPTYMAPEQARGSDVDHRADVYGLAAIAYRALTGRVLFSAREVPSIIHDVVYRMPPRPGGLAKLPAAVDAVMAVALCKQRDDRFATAVELASALRSAQAGSVDVELQRRSAAVLSATPWDASA